MPVNIYEKLGNKISVELQLRTEEKWILETLEKIREERNRLQIEALHLESLKAKFNWNKKDSTITKDSKPIASAPIPHDIKTNHKIEIVQEEELCNKEELNLMVSDHPTLVETIIEDNSEEEEDDASDIDDVLLDIHMLMFGNKKN